MPWQRLVADVALELNPDGTPAFRTVVLTVPRQAGKTTLSLCVELHRALLWGSRQFIAFTAQDGNAARRKLLEDQLPIINASPFTASVKQVIQAAGREGIEFVNGSRLALFGSSESAGHGRTIDLAISDEAFKDADSRREQAMLPAMATRPDAQFWIVSTAGTEESLWLLDKVRAGRQAVENDLDSGICFFEWSADPLAPIDDPETWRSCNPAIGNTISETVVRDALATMAEDEFRRAFLNQWVGSTARMIPEAAWDACVSSTAQLAGDLTLAVDTNPDRTFASICLADKFGTVELSAYGAGTSWVAPKLIELAKQHRATVVLDKVTSAGYLPDLERANVRVHAISVSELTTSAAKFFVSIGDQVLRVRANELIDELDRSVAIAEKRPIGDAWAWRRKDLSSDLSPLVAASLAHWGASAFEPARRDFFALLD